MHLVTACPPDRSGDHPGPTDGQKRTPPAPRPEPRERKESSADRSCGSDPLVSRRRRVGETLLLTPHVDQNHLEPAPSTETSATTGATLADHRTTMATVDDFFMANPSLASTQPRAGSLRAMTGQQAVIAQGKGRD